MFIVYFNISNNHNREKNAYDDIAIIYTYMCNLLRISELCGKY